MSEPTQQSNDHNAVPKPPAPGQHSPAQEGVGEHPPKDSEDKKDSSVKR
jgi:hypothetical protein